MNLQCIENQFIVKICCDLFCNHSLCLRVIFYKTNLLKKLYGINTFPLLNKRAVRITPDFFMVNVSFCKS